MGTTPGLAPRDGRLPDLAAPSAAPAGPGRGRGRRAVERTLELLLALLLTLLCFVALLALLNRVFPSATSLGDLMRTAGVEESTPRPKRNEDWAEALLSVMDNEVLRKQAGSVAWDPAKTGLRLTEGDGVQTRREGTAVMTFDRDDWLRVGRNSLVILGHADEYADSPTTSLALVSGEAWGHFTGRRGGSVRVEIPGGRRGTRTASLATDGNPSRFKVAVRRDHSTAVTVYAGRTTLTMGERTVRLGPSQYVVMKGGEFAGSVRTLPGAPAVSLPDDGRTWHFREFPPAVTFRWGGARDAEVHRLTIARDPAFRDVVFDETVHGDSLALGSLPPGEYLWRVSVVDGGVDGVPSPTRHLSLVLDDVPPALDVVFPAGPVGEDRCIVEGITEPRCRLYVAGEPVPAGADGRFQCDTPLKPGTNLVVVEAVDAAGNSTYRSQIVRRTVQH